MKGTLNIFLPSEGKSSHCILDQTHGAQSFSSSQSFRRETLGLDSRTTGRDWTKLDLRQQGFFFFFYNNRLISCALIGSFLSTIRVQMDKVLIYASFQVQLSAAKTVVFFTNEILWTFSQSKSEKRYWQCSHHFEKNSLIFVYRKFTASFALIYSQLLNILGLLL